MSAFSTMGVRTTFVAMLAILMSLDSDASARQTLYVRGGHPPRLAALCVHDVEELRVVGRHGGAGHCVLPLPWRVDVQVEVVPLL